MKALACAFVAAVIATASPCAAAQEAKCARQPAMVGMHERIAALRDQMDRIEAATDRAEQRRLMEMNAKLMREGMREIRSRDLAAPCRVEMMASMMEVMIRHQQAMQDAQAAR